MLTFRVVVIRHLPVAVQCDTDLAPLLLLELFTIELDGTRVRKNQAVTHASTAEDK